MLWSPNRCFFFFHLNYLIFPISGNSPMQNLIEHGEVHFFPSFFQGFSSLILGAFLSHLIHFGVLMLHTELLFSAPFPAISYISFPEGSQIGAEYSRLDHTRCCNFKGLLLCCMNDDNTMYMFKLKPYSMR